MIKIRSKIKQKLRGFALSHCEPMPPSAPLNFRKRNASAFTLVELLVSMLLLIIITGIVVQTTNQTSQIWISSRSRIQSFQEARAGFQAMTAKLSQATLNTYFDYYGTTSTVTGTIARSTLSGTTALANFIPSTYDRYSDLHFVSGQAAAFKLLLSASAATTGTITTQTQAAFFQSPLGYSADPNYQELDNALNACGYFLQFDEAKSYVPPHIVNSTGYIPRYRFRLMEMTQPTEQLVVYSGTSNDWFVKNAVANSRIIAENVIALVILPKLPASQDDPDKAGGGVTLAPFYNYNSRVPFKATQDPSWTSFPGDSFTAYPMAGGTSNGTRHAQLPPMMRVVMVVIDETSAARIQGASTTVPAAINLASTALFTDAKKLDQDIQSVEDICNAKPGNATGNTVKLTHRVFSTEIILPAAKWSNK